MSCEQVKRFLDEHFPASGMDISTEIETHIADCPECRAYADELAALAKKLDIIGDIEMTADEILAFDTGLSGTMDGVEKALHGKSRSAGILAVFRPLMAAAAVLAMMLLMPAPEPEDNTSLFEALDQVQFSRAMPDDIVVVFTNGETDLLPAIIDDSSATYITGQVSHYHADDILEGASTEEIEWLMENLSLEI